MQISIQLDTLVSLPQSSSSCNFCLFFAVDLRRLSIALLLIFVLKRRATVQVGVVHGDDDRTDDLDEFDLHDDLGFDDNDNDGDGDVDGDDDVVGTTNLSQVEGEELRE